MVIFFCGWEDCLLSSIPWESQMLSILCVSFDLCWGHRLGYNAYQTQMFQIPSLIIMSIAATRMHRSLVDYVSGLTSVYDGSFFPFFRAHRDRCRSVRVAPRTYCPSASTTNQMPTTRIQGNQLEVAVHTTHMQYPPSQTSLYDSMHRQLGGERPSLDLHDDLESNV